MQHLTIIVPDGQGNNLSSIVGAYKIFTRANEYWKKTGRKELFKIELAGISKKVEFYDGLFTVKPHTHISFITKTTLIIIPSLNHNYQKAVKANKLLQAAFFLSLKPILCSLILCSSLLIALKQLMQFLYPGYLAKHTFFLLP